MRTIRASEIGTYLYCTRSWWYQRQGHESENQVEMAAGTQIHEQHHRAVLSAGCLRTLAYAVLLLALAVLAVYLTDLLL